MADQPRHPAALPAPPLLVGRERELAILRDALAAAISERGSLVLIGGEAGVGKTALAEALLAEAKGHGATVLVGRCYDLTETPPYGPWVEALARAPGGGDLPPPPDLGGGDATSQAALFAVVRDYLAALAAAQPVVLLLDDLHWADPASLDLLRVLGRQLANLPLLLLVTYRADELTRRHPLYGLLTTQLLRALEDEGVLRQADEAWTLGDLGAVGLPAPLRQVLDGRLARLGEDSKQLLTLAAIIGQEVPLALWAAVAETDEDGLLGTVDAATEAHLVTVAPDGSTVHFAHALIREVLYEGLVATRRRRVHRRVAEALAGGNLPAPDAVAYHFQHAGDRRAVEWLIRAGERAQLAYAWLTAIERYEAALALLEGSGEDLAQQGWLHYRSARLRRHGTPERSLDHLDEALRIATAIGDLALADAARYTRGLCLHYTADPGTAILEMAAGADALEALPPDQQARLDLGPAGDDAPAATNPRGFLVSVLAASGRIAEALAVGEGSREGRPRHTALGELGWSHYGDRHGGLGIAYALAGRPGEARAAFERAYACLSALGNHGPLGATMVFDLLLVSLPYYTDRPDDRVRLAEASTAARQRAQATVVRYERLAHLPALALAGRWAEAREGASVAARIAGQREWRDIATAVLGDIAHAQGEPEEAWMHVHDLLPDGPRTVPGTMPWWQIVLPRIARAAALSLDSGDLVAAQAWLAAHDRWLAWSGALLGRAEDQVLWGRYSWQSDDLDLTHEHAERAYALATDPPQPLALLAAHRLLGELATEAGRYDAAERHLEASLSLGEVCAAPYERALTLLALAELRAAREEHDDACAALAAVRAWNEIT